MLWQVVSQEHTAWPPSNPRDMKAAFDVPEPTVRSGHTVTAIPDGRLLLFGGWDGYKPLSDAYLYHPQIGTWTQILRGPESEAVLAPQACGNVWPKPTAFHSATLFVEQEDEGKGGIWRVIILGGRGMSDMSDTVYQLTIYGNNSSSNPRARSGTPEDIRRARYSQSSDGGYVSKFYTRDSPKLEWEVISFSDAEAHPARYHDPAFLPPDRMMHTTTLVDDSCLLVLGGQGRAGRRLGDLWQLDLLSWKWRQIPIRGWGPASGHQTVLIRKGRLLVFGGLRDDNVAGDSELWYIDYHKADQVPILDAEAALLEDGSSKEERRHGQGISESGSAAGKPLARHLHSMTEVLLDPDVLQEDPHGDQGSDVHLQPPVAHPTLEPRYFFGREQQFRDGWSRSIESDNLFRLHWAQQYDRNRRYLVYGGFSSSGAALSELWELRIFDNPARRLAVLEGETLTLPPGAIGVLEDAAYGERTAFLDVTARLAEHISEDGSIAGVLVGSLALGIIDRNDSEPEKRWRDNVTEWASETGSQDPFPGVRKKLVVKYRAPPGEDCTFAWVQVPAHAVRRGAAVGGAGVYQRLGDAGPGSFCRLDDQNRPATAYSGGSALSRGRLGTANSEKSHASAQPGYRAIGDGQGGGDTLGIPAGRGGHTAVRLEQSSIGVGGLLILGGSAREDAKPSFALPTVRGRHSVAPEISNALAILLVICPVCAAPMVKLPVRYCQMPTCNECRLHNPMYVPEW